MAPTDNKQTRDYLLGNLTEVDRAEFEQRLLRDGQLFEDLLISEQDLVDEYFSGGLTEPEKERFQSHFLIAPSRQASFRFGRTFNKYLQQKDVVQPAPVEVLPPRKASRSAWNIFGDASWIRPFNNRPAVAFSLVAVVFVVAVATYWALTQKRSNNGEFSGQTVVVTVMPGAIRSEGGIARAQITADTGAIQLQLAVPSNQFETYRAELFNEGVEIGAFKDLKPVVKDGQKLVVVKVKAPESGDYLLKLSGVSSTGLEPVDNYYFRVVTR